MAAGIRKNAQKRRKRRSKSVSFSDFKESSSKSCEQKQLHTERKMTKCYLCNVDIEVSTSVSQIIRHEKGKLHQSKSGVNVHETLYKCYCCNKLFSKTNDLMRHLEFEPDEILDQGTLLSRNDGKKNPNRTNDRLLPKSVIVVSDREPKHSRIDKRQRNESIWSKKSGKSFSNNQYWKQERFVHPNLKGVTKRNRRFGH